ncbi:septal ring lytic transglycosylase RlpA family protein [Hyalangium sp.]|uniref:septal ring lytic transglycosylase RlpA family protein n=1 Tax=Hyalangium sp. TaxID=2028555 RepID=UPI002D6A2A36|nr:septal ring lytic transglycosylase RlpA family protein [Hyalangium sp.]HYH99111.1 septal ring lytic transglycosylase RlpA family protein [Hyalangium sp.]
MSIALGKLLAVALGVGLLTGCASRAARPAPSARAEPSTEGKAPRTYLGEGLASYYGPGFHGRKTANGERFDQNAMTAAHRTVRFGTCLRVVNMENGKSVEVRVNDRGPFKDDRVIDVSLGAARKLEMVEKGLARVRLYRCKDEEPSSAFSIPLQALPG